MIYNFIAYTPSQAPAHHGNYPWLGDDARKAINLGWTYNQYMKMLPNDDDWACFLDHDAMFTTNNWYQQLEAVIEKHPEYGLFTAMTNRIGHSIQRVRGIDPSNHDMKYSRKLGLELQEKYYDQVTEMPRVIAGVLMLTKKSVWKATDGFKNGFLGIDSNYDGQVRKLAGYKVGLMDGVFVYHWYREKLNEDKPALKS